MNNVKVAYILSFLWRSWFWLGIWVLYDLRYTDYAGIGFLETIMITTSTLGEIPTGAIADILGKKKAISIAFLLGGIGNLVMAFAPNYWVLVISIITMTIGGAFYSGSLEAIVYDSLKQENLESIYNKVIGRITTMQNLGMAFAGITGGFLYQWHVSAPFLAVAFAYAIGFVMSFTLKEPLVDTTKYSFAKFVEQNVQGFRQLFPDKRLGILIIALLIPGSFMLASENVLNDATAIELGFNSIQLGIFSTSLYLFGVLVSERTTLLVNLLPSKWLYSAVLATYVITLILMPQVGVALGALLLLARYGVQTIYGNYESIRINAVIDSKYRATTLSTYSLLRNIPYALTATLIGAFISLYTARVFSVYFAVVFVIIMALYLVARKLSGRTRNA